MAQTHITALLFAEFGPCHTGYRDNGFLRFFCFTVGACVSKQQLGLCGLEVHVCGGGSMIMSALLVTFESVMAAVTVFASVLLDGVCVLFK